MLRTRVAMAAIALALCAWLALQERATHDQSQAARVVNQQVVDPASAARARKELDQARAVNPDEELNILRAELALRTGDRSTAIGILSHAVRREPANINAWLALAVVTDPVDPALNRTAIARVHQLAPHVAPAP